MRKVSTRLADGRELLYYDAGGAPPRVARDTRDLPPYAPRVEVRRDPLLDEPVVVASHRQERTFLPTADDCPLCPSAPDRPTEIPEYDYEVAVFENRFPSFTAGTRGRCEVVCFTSRHDGRFADLPVRRARLVVDVWADRTEALAALPGVEQVFCFENRGEEIGVTLHHPHGQIYAYPFVTPTTLRQLETAEAHRAATGRDLFADVLAREREAGIRVLAETSHWTAFVPASARWPFEVHLYPHRAVPDLPALDDEERDELAAVYLDLLRALDALFGVSLPYVAAWHQAPTRERRGLARLHLQLFSVRRAPGKLKYLAGSEAAMGVWVNDVVPEDAAALLRAALQSSRAPSEAAQIQARPREP